MSDNAEAQKPIHEAGVIGTLRAIDRLLGKVEAVLLSVLLSALIAVAAYQAIRRNLFPPSPNWSPELIQYSTFFIGLLGAALATQSKQLINIDMLTRLFSSRGKLMVRLVTTLFTIYACSLFVRGGWALRVANLSEKGEIIDPPDGILALPIAAGLIAMHLLLHGLIDAYYLAVGRIPRELEGEVPRG